MCVFVLSEMQQTLWPHYMYVSQHKYRMILMPCHLTTLSPIDPGIQVPWQPTILNLAIMAPDLPGTRLPLHPAIMAPATLISKWLGEEFTQAVNRMLSSFL